MKRCILILSIAALIAGCQKEFNPEGVSLTGVTPDASLPDTAVFYDAVINGNREFHVSGQQGYMNYWSGGPDYTGGNQGTFEQGIMSSSNTNALILFRGLVKFPATDTNNVLKNQSKIAAFAQAGYNYTSDPNNSSGIILRWRDGSGKEWGTDYGAATQNGSNFSITQLTQTPVYPNGLVHGIFVYCVYNCTLYDKNGNSITVKDGKMRISVWL